ncbi:unnamed protein product [Boreogadus saida]
MSRKKLAWANKEVETFVCILGEEDVVYDVYVAAAAIDIRPTTKAPETGVGGRPESDGAAAGTRITVLKTPVEGVTNRHERDEQRGARRRSNLRH